MPLIAFFIAVLAAGMATYWLLGCLYGLLRNPPVYFPVGLAAKMSAATIVGVIAAGIGAIVLPAVLFAVEFGKRPDYRPATGLLAAGLISLLGAVAMAMLAYAIAPAVFG